MRELFAADAETGDIVETVTITKSDLKDLQQALLASKASEARLRDALNDCVSTKLDEYGHHQIMSGKDEFQIIKLLSTPPDTSALRDWMMGQLGEPVAYRFGDSQVVSWNEKCAGDKEFTPLYALRKAE